jgi:hypothetical protein
MINNFFHACAAEEITITDKYIVDMTEIFWNAFECEFTGQKGLNKFWRKLDNAYQNWYDKVYKVPGPGEEDYRPDRHLLTKNSQHQDTYGTTFMIELLRKKGFKHQLPKPLVDFKPAKADLW